MDSKQLMSDIIVYSKYSKYNPDLKRRETWEELVTRNAEMHARKYPQVADEVYEVYARSVISKKVVPSMRSFQFAGKAIENNHSRLFNCAARKLDCATAFAEVMFLLLGGSGVGISVQKHHVDKIRAITTPRQSHRRYVIQDSIIGWADAIKVLLKSYMYDRSYIDFDYSEIRPKGAILKTAGGKAPGPEPLKKCINNIRRLLDRAIEDRGEGAKIRPIEAHDIACYISNAVIAGGIRRSAMISLFSPDDEDMLSCKGNFSVNVRDVTKLPNGTFNVELDYKGRTETLLLTQWDLDQLRETGKIAWYHLEEQRGRANNSVVLLRGSVSKEYFYTILKKVEESHAGEPGVFWTNNLEVGTNPCGEISLDISGGFCNLTEINVSDIESEEDLKQRVRDAVFLGTLQAGYTEFHYLGDQWREIAERDALLGVSMTGIASGEILKYNLLGMSTIAIEENKRVASLVGINPAKRIGTIKPSGTASLVFGCSSGIHAWFNDYYVRRIRIGKDEALYSYLLEKLGEDFVEDEQLNSERGVLSIPVEAPEGSTLRTESPIDLLERVKKFQVEWIRGTHIDGDNSHNVSVTVNVNPNEWGEVTDWMWNNKDIYNGISLLDYDGGTYPQMPHEDINKEQYEEIYNKLVEKLKDFCITDVQEEVDNTNHKAEAACAGGSCEINSI